MNKYLGLAFISASVLALQVIFTRIFSIMIWHHFTYLVIGVALLGSGAAGTYLTIHQWDERIISRRISKLALAFSISILLTLLVITQVQFDPLSAKEISKTLIGATIYFASLFITFFLGGLTIVSAFRLWINEVHRLYFADLLGAGVSMLVVVWLIQTFSGPSSIAFIALLALAASLLFSVGLSGSQKLTILVVAIALGQAGLFFSTLVNPIQLPIPKSKSLAWALDFAGVSRPEYTRWNPVARVDVLPPVRIDYPMIVGGISSHFASQNSLKQEGYTVRFVTLDGTSMTGLYQFDGDLSRFQFLRHAIISAPYQVSIDQPTTLNIGVGGGIDIILARLYNSKHITAIDLNADVIALLTGQYADFSGRLANDPHTTLIAAEGRSFLMRNNTQYDIIQGIGLDNIAALSAGAYVLSESYLYTVDALELALKRLTPQGIFSWTRDTSNPPSETLRLTGLAAEALRRNGITNPGQHIAIIANEANTTVTLLVSRQPFASSAIQRLREWSTLNGFHLLHDPFTRLDTPYADYLYAPDPRAFEAAYPFNISPVTDDNPFYYNHFKWSNLLYRAQRGSASVRFPIGNLILLAILSFTAIAAAIFIWFPLLRYKRSSLKMPYALPMLVYFSALGLGYIFVEIVLIQRFTLFIGYPTHAITTTIFSMLSFSAIGSLISRAICKTPIHLRSILLILTGLILLYTIGLPLVFQSLLQLPDVLRTLLSIVLIAPLAFLMGMPFPTGLWQLGVRARSLVPWAWGMNGVFSVMGSALVILISMTTSFTIALMSAALFYSIAAAISSSLWKAQVEVS